MKVRHFHWSKLKSLIISLTWYKSSSPLTKFQCIYNNFICWFFMVCHSQTKKKKTLACCPVCNISWKCVWGVCVCVRVHAHMSLLEWENGLKIVWTLNTPALMALLGCFNCLILLFQTSLNFVRLCLNGKYKISVVTITWQWVFGDSSESLGE